jgi:5-methylcytosine-specific restriction endonuclease McrA
MGFFESLSAMMSPRTMGKRRSKDWPKVREAHLSENPACIVCGSTNDCEVHHILPFHVFPEHELDPRNLRTLCESRDSCNCHITFGHFGNWSLYNPDVDRDARVYLNGIIQAKLRK